MAHKTLIGGTAYNITGGKSMVSGTSYNIAKGYALVDGARYEISFDLGTANQAVLYNTGDFVFQNGTKGEEGKTTNAIYSISNSNYAYPQNVAWNNKRNSIKNIYCTAELSSKSMTGWFYSCPNLYRFNTDNFNTESIFNMVNAFANCPNLIMKPVCGNNVVNMSNAYSSCSNLTGQPVCGNNVTDMSNAYRGCRNLTGSPVCGNNVTDMSNAYRGCSNLTGSPVCGNNVVNMSNAYSSCSNLTGQPVCGNNVTNMNTAYSSCSNLTGQPVCGPNVIDMSYAYSYCNRLSGSAVCGRLVKKMYSAYTNSFNLTRAICGPNVESISYAYTNCRNISGNAYFYSPYVTSAKSCFSGRNSSRRLNIYVINRSTTYSTILNTGSYCIIADASFNKITWTNNGTYFYNALHNIYIYPVANVAAAAIANGDEEANANAGIV